MKCMTWKVEHTVKAGHSVKRSLPRRMVKHKSGGEPKCKLPLTAYYLGKSLKFPWFSFLSSGMIVGHTYKGPCSGTDSGGLSHGSS